MDLAHLFFFYKNMIFIKTRLPQGQQEIQQRKILYMGLYLLIWGEAANVRFMPECLCYIFHNVRSFFALTAEYTYDIEYAIQGYVII